MSALDEIFVATGTRMDDGAFDEAGNKLDCNANVLRAIWKVEAAGRPFDNRGRLTILPERHKIYVYSPPNLREKLLESGYARKKWVKSQNYIGLGTMDLRYEFLKGLRDFLVFHRSDDPEYPGFMGTSWGGAQIMGFNHNVCGYDTAREMVKDFSFSEDAQLGALVQFLLHNGLMDAIRIRDFEMIARRYNGAGQVQLYASRMRKAFAELEGGAAADSILPDGWYNNLRIGSSGDGVEELQKKFLSLGYYLGSWGPGGDGVDGDFGPATEQAVKLFQRRKGLEESGIVDDNTRAALALD